MSARDDQRARIDSLILAVMLRLAAEGIPATAREISVQVIKRDFLLTRAMTRRALRRLAIDGMVVEWGPIEREKGPRGPNPSTWQLTAEGEAAAMEGEP